MDAITALLELWCRLCHVWCMAFLSSQSVPVTHLIIAVPVCRRGFVPVVLASSPLGESWLPTSSSPALESLDSSGLGSVGGVSAASLSALESLDSGGLSSVGGASFCDLRRCAFVVLTGRPRERWFFVVAMVHMFFVRRSANRCFEPVVGSW